MPDERGYYGKYGGRFVPETLMPALIELEENFRACMKDEAFKEELSDYLKHYVGRESPLYLAKRLTEYCGGARIYLKREDLNHTGAHKINNALAQVLLSKRMGKHRIVAETGAGQWGSALSFGGAVFGVEIKIYMVKISYEQKPYRRVMMETWGAKCVPSPSTDTKAGRAVLAKEPDCPGSLGIAISEAVEEALSRDDTHYALGSVLNHVLLHQTINGIEAKILMEKADRRRL